MPLQGCMRVHGRARAVVQGFALYRRRAWILLYRPDVCPRGSETAPADVPENNSGGPEQDEVCNVAASDFCMEPTADHAS